MDTIQHPVLQPTPDRRHGLPYTYESRDGWACGMRLGSTDSGPGLRVQPEISETEGPWLVCRESWDSEHPGVEPTVVALLEAMLRAEDDMIDSAIRQAR